MTIERFDNMQVELSNYLASLSEIEIKNAEIGKRDATLQRDVILASFFDDVLLGFSLNDTKNPTLGEFSNTLEPSEYLEILQALNRIYGTNMNYDFIQPIEYQF